MAKSTSVFVCSNCSNETSRWAAKCPACGDFSTLEEKVSAQSSVSLAGLKSTGSVTPIKSAMTIKELSKKPIKRTPTGINELDRVLGGGFVDGEVVLLAAAPGAGKALKDDTLIPLADGGFKTMEDVAVNDELIDIDGNRTRVLAKFNPSIEKAYRLTFSDGTTVDSCEDHLWSLYDMKKHRKDSHSKKILTSFFSEDVTSKEVEKVINDLNSLKNKQNVVSLKEICDLFYLNKRILSMKTIEFSIATIAKNSKSIINPKTYHNKLIDTIISRIKKEFYNTEYDTKTLTASEIFKNGISYKTGSDFRKSWAVPIKEIQTYSEQDLLIDPYTLGLWLGDGFSAGSRLCAEEKDMKEYVNYSFLINENRIKVRKDNNLNVVNLQFENIKNDGYLVHVLRDLNLINNKHIPKIYLYSSIEQRKELLRGLMDTDGSISSNRSGAEIGFSNQELADNVKQLIVSLGMEANVKIKQPKKNGEKYGNLHYRISFTPNFDCVKLTRKLKNLKLDRRQGNRHTLKYLTNIEEIEPVGEYYCIMVDSKSKTFMCTENFVPTHNSTLSLSIAAAYGEMGKTVLYSSGEESEQQIGLRAERMKINNDQIKIVNETNLETLLGHIDQVQPELLIVDSLQTLASTEIPGSIGSVSQSKEAAHNLTRLAKSNNITMVLISQVVKSGDFAGSEAVQHIVDCSLMIDSDRDTPLKFLRAVKNRFGSCDEVGVFQHGETGLEEVSDPSGVFMDDTSSPHSGTAYSFISEGIRQLPVEVQSLVSRSTMPTPRRQFNGVDYNRGQIVCAILDKFCKTHLYEKDVFVSTVSGVKVKDPQSDLAMAVAILSSSREKTLKEKIAFIGELSLTGRIRGNFMIEQKIKEAERLGFDKIIIPSTQKNKIKNSSTKIKIEYITTIEELTKYFGGEK